MYCVLLCSRLLNSTWLFFTFYLWSVLTRFNKHPTSCGLGCRLASGTCCSCSVSCSMRRWRQWRSTTGSRVWQSQVEWCWPSSSSSWSSTNARARVRNDSSNDCSFNSTRSRVTSAMNANKVRQHTALTSASNSPPSYKSRGRLQVIDFCSVLTTDLYKVRDAVPPIHAVSSHVATDKGPSIDGGKFRSILAAIYNQSQLAERKHVARYLSITAVPVSAHPSPLVITTKLAAAILVVAVVRTRGSAGPVLPLWY